MDENELLELFFNRSYEKFVNKQILDDKNYIVPRQQLINYVHKLVNIPYYEFIFYIKKKGIDRTVEVSDITQFSSFSACEIEMCNALIWANNPGCQYLDIGRFFPNKIFAKSDSSYKRYGEIHIKASTQLGLTFEYYDYWYLSCLGYVYPDLEEDLRIRLLARTIIRNRLYQQLLVDILEHKVNPEEYINICSEQTIRRRLRNVCSFFDICLTECKRENIITFRHIKNYVVNENKAIIQLPTGINKNLQKYLESFDYHILSNETTISLIKKYRKGDHKAADLLIKGYMNLVISTIETFKYKGIGFEDLIQEGVIGLIRAFDHFNTHFNNDFCTYAQRLIRQALNNASIIHPMTVKIPLNVNALHRKIWSFVNSFEQEKGFLPSINDINIAETEDLKWINYIYKLPQDLKEVTTLIPDLDIFESDDNKTDDFQERDYSRYYLNTLLHRLNKRHRLILTKYYGLEGNPEGVTLTTIGDILGLTRERVRQIVSEAICQMRELCGIKREEAKKGDMIRLDLTGRRGRVMNIKKAVDGSDILVLRMDNRTIQEVNTKDTLYTIVKSGIIGKLPKNDTPSTQIIKKEIKKKEITSEKKLEQYKPTIQGEVYELNGFKVGERIVYNNNKCTICKIILRGNSSRLAIKYDNNVLDIVQMESILKWGSKISSSNE